MADDFEIHKPTSLRSLMRSSITRSGS